ncbi:MAG: putative sulfate exporter family transporter [Wenzhouxiangella sp.]|nr:MAG: putative sulfate exporter family transporter [Wenzhouxiangella sp.]
MQPSSAAQEVTVKARPGLAVAAALAALAWLLIGLLQRLPEPLSSLPASPMLVAILAGLALGGVAARRPAWQHGLELARGPLLKIAVALIGLRLSLVELGLLSGRAVPLVVVVIALGLGLTYGLARLAGGGRRLAGLLAVGTAICGVSAIAALAPGIRARPDETAYAIACVALVGLLATLFYPLLLQSLLVDPVAIGLVMGGAIHDTAQVTAAAVAHEQLWQVDGTLNAATVTKLIRNFSMVLVIPVLAWLLAEHDAGPRLVPIPLFIVAFLALSAVRSLGDAVVGADHPVWTGLTDVAGVLSQFLFAMAMTAIAMGIRLAHLRELGWRPAAAAFIAAVAVLAAAIAWVRWW